MCPKRDPSAHQSTVVSQTRPIRELLISVATVYIYCQAKSFETATQEFKNSLIGLFIQLLFAEKVVIPIFLKLLVRTDSS